MLTSRTFWGGVAICSMWLAVLIVGVYGGNVVSTSAGGGSSSWPVDAVIALFALLATISVARYAFRSSPADDGLRGEIEHERRAREQLAAEVAGLREKLSS